MPAEGLPARTLLVLHLAEMSGPSVSLEPAIRRLAEAGQVDVLVPGPGAAADRYGRFARVEVAPIEALTLQGGPLALARRVRRLGAAVGELRRLIRARRPDLVVQTTLLLPAVAVAARREKVPVIVHAGELFPRTGVRALGGRLVASATARSASGVAACSEPVARQFRSRRARVRTILPPIDPAYGSGDRARGREALAIGPEADCVLAVGSISAGRGQDTLIRAMAEVRRTRPGARCLIVGAPHPRPQDRRFADGLRTLAGALGPSGFVVFAGSLMSVADAYAAADVVVNPARCEEAFGRVAFEAALAGRPTVSTTVGAVTAYLRNGESALLVAKDDPPAMARAILRLLGDPDLGEDLAAAAARFARSELDPAASAQEFVELAAEVLRS